MSPSIPHSRPAQQTCAMSSIDEAPASLLAEQHVHVRDRQPSPLSGLHCQPENPPEAPSTRVRGNQQSMMPLTAPQEDSGCQHEGTRKRVSSQACGAPQHSQGPSKPEKASALPYKRARLDDDPSQMERAACEMPPLQTKSGSQVAQGSPADMRLGVNPPQEARACNLHATLRCARSHLPLHGCPPQRRMKPAACDPSSLPQVEDICLVGMQG